MKKMLFITACFLFIFCFNQSCFGFDVWKSQSKINSKHIRNDLIGKDVQGWVFQKLAPSYIKVMDCKYDKDNCIVYIFIKTTNIDGNSGVQGKLRLQYEYAASDWNLLSIKTINLSKLDRNAAKKVIEEILSLITASKKGNLSKVKALLTEGCDTTIMDKYGLTALDWAAAQGHDSVVKFLLKKGADVNLTSPLIAASGNGHALVVSTLLNNGADINACSQGETPLMAAVIYGHYQVVKILLKKCANVNVKDKKGLSVLFNSIKTMWDRPPDGKKKIVELLEKAGANFGLTSKNLLYNTWINFISLLKIGNYEAAYSMLSKKLKRDASLHKFRELFSIKKNFEEFLKIEPCGEEYKTNCNGLLYYNRGNLYEISNRPIEFVLQEGKWKIDVL